MCASQWVLNKPAANEVQAGGGRPHSGSPFLAGGAPPETRRVPLWKWRSLRAKPLGPKNVPKNPDRARPKGNLGEVVAVLLRANRCQNLVCPGVKG
ncbi:hypothetical protein JTE90_006720 [Oedothorax gibbosus]|uniref:Uncharacterized protein n=1 Tax=Oedothorax gibbosus TaxID=931172 RepID=A0AAV6TGR3_9ARAC|nr:hypothetical protein JTE90_006720 [Oedothorax gibbosus]